MTADRFRKLEEEFLSVSQYFMATAQDSLCQAREAIESPSPKLPDCTGSQLAELCLRPIAERLEDLMTLHDELQVEIGMSKRYWSFFDSLDLTPEGWRKLREILKTHKAKPE